MNTQTLADAMGRTEGDYLELSNQWARVFVTRETVGRLATFVVSGDIIDPRKHEITFHSLSKAMAYAVRSLGEYRRGSPGQH